MRRIRELLQLSRRARQQLVECAAEHTAFQLAQIEAFERTTLWVAGLSGSGFALVLTHVGGIPPVLAQGRTHLAVAGAFWGAALLVACFVLQQSRFARRSLGREVFFMTQWSRRVHLAEISWLDDVVDAFDTDPLVGMSPRLPPRPKTDPAPTFGDGKESNQLRAFSLVSVCVFIGGVVFALAALCSFATLSG